MKFKYIYKTSDGVRHEAKIDAPTREDVFIQLRAQKIKPIKVIATDGSKANGADYGVRKRVVVAVAMAAASVAAAVVFLISGNRQGNGGAQVVAKPLVRQYIPGDRSKIEEFNQRGLETVLERYLLRFAEPGRQVSSKESDWPTKSDVEFALKRPLTYTEDEPTEVVYLKRIVVGMKNELARYLKGGGYLSGYYSALMERQKQEVKYREDVLKKLKEIKDEKKAYDFWLKANAYLDSFGIYPIEMPSRLRNYQAMHGIDE